MNEFDSRQHVIQACRDHDVKFIRLWFTDILGSLKSFAITVEELERRGIVERRVTGSSPVRVEYELTQRGRELDAALTELKRWADRWLD